MFTSPAVTRLVHVAFITAGALAFGGAAYLSLPAMNTDASLPRAKMFVHEIPITVEMATTDASREKGLSERTSLPEGTGMIFTFGAPGRWGIWMKDMRFHIDIVWLDRKGKVITVEKNVAPETYPKIFVPESDAWYALELPAGETERYLIAPGDMISLPQLQ